MSRILFVRKAIFLVIVLLLLVAHSFVEVSLDTLEGYVTMRLEGISHEQAICSLGQWVDNLFRYADDYIELDYRLGEQVQDAYYNEYCTVRGVSSLG